MAHRWGLPRQEACGRGGRRAAAVALGGDSTRPGPLPPMQLGKGLASS